MSLLDTIGGQATLVVIGAGFIVLGIVFTAVRPLRTVRLAGLRPA